MEGNVKLKSLEIETNFLKLYFFLNMIFFFNLGNAPKKLRINNKNTLTNVLTMSLMLPPILETNFPHLT